MMNQETPKKLPKLTKKQRGFVNDYVETENGTQSVLKNYNLGSLGSERKIDVAKSIASENLSKPYIYEAIEVKRKSLKQALIDQGITEDYLAKKVDKLLTSDDESSIDKGLKHATSIYGIQSDDDRPKVNNTYNFLFSEETKAEVKQIEEKIKARLMGQQNDKQN